MGVFVGPNYEQERVVRKEKRACVLVNYDIKILNFKSDFGDGDLKRVVVGSEPQAIIVYVLDGCGSEAFLCSVLCLMLVGKRRRLKKIY